MHLENIPVLFVLVAGLLFANEVDYILPSGQHFLLLFFDIYRNIFFGVVVFQKPLTSLIMRILNIRTDHHVIVSNLSKQILIVIPIFCALLFMVIFICQISSLKFYCFLLAQLLWFFIFYCHLRHFEKFEALRHLAQCFQVGPVISRLIQIH